EGRLPRLLQLMYLGNGEIVRYQPDEADLLATERKVEALWQAIERARTGRDWRPRPRRSPPDTANSTPAAPATITPTHTRGENTNDDAKSPMAVPICQSILIAPVRYAASGSSDQATPRRPAATPRRRQASQL